MKKVFFLIMITFGLTLTSCETVGSKERGVEVSWGGETNMSKIYEPGIHYGAHWITDELVNYDVSQQTEVEKFDFNDKNNMTTGVEVAVDFSIDPSKPQYLHTKITDWKIKLQKTIKSAAKEIIPQYSASELNLTKRGEAEGKLAAILSKELPEIFLQFDRVQITDVDIPKEISDASIATAKQAELNKLSEAKVLESENNFKAAEWQAKTQDVLSKPAMLELKRLEIDLEYAQKGVSKYGTNNVFGASPSLLLNR